MVNKKKLIAYVFVSVMILSAFAGLASIIPANASSHITPSVTGSGTGSSESETVTVNLGICGDVTGSANVSHSTYDIGQQIQFTVHAMRTNNDGRINLYVDGTCVASVPQWDGQLYDYTPSSSGTISWYICAPNQGGHPTSGTATITVNSDPSISIVSATSSYQNTAFSLSSDVSGGTTPYTYSWSVSGVSGSFSSTTAQNPTFTSSDSGTATFTVTLTDATGFTATASKSVAFTPPLSISASSSHNPWDAATSITYTASVSGGSGDYTSYSYILYDGTSTSDSELASGSTSSFSYTYGSGGSYLLTYSVTDSYGNTASTSLTQTVDPALTISISETHNPSDEGQDITYDTSVSGGSGTYSSYSYILYDGTSTSDSELASGSTSSFSYIYDSTGSYLLVYSVTDSNGNTVSSSLTQTVNPDITVAISSSQNPTDAGKTVEFTSSVSGGTIPYNYTWEANGNDYYTNDINVTFSSSGSYIIDLTVTDAAGYSVSTSMSETVNSDPVVSASSNVSSADIGYPIEFSSSPSGGTAPYSYSWTLNGNVISTSQDFSYSFSNSGSYTLTVTVTDAVGETYSSSVTVTINPNPSVSISSSQNPTDSGNSVTFLSSVSGGTGTISYVWYVDSTEESTSSSFSYTFSSTGTYYINITVTDSDGHTASYSYKETVNPDPSVVIKASHNPADVGIAVNFTATINGGTSPYTYSWTVNGVSSSKPYIVYTFTSPGTFTVDLTVTDSAGNKATDSINEVVNPDPSVSINSEYNPVDQGVNDTLTAEISGGTGPYNYTWSLGSTILNYSSSFKLKFNEIGSFEVNLTIEDSLGEKDSTQITIKVIEKPSATIIGNNQTDVNTETYWEGYGSFGTAPYSYYWYINGVNTTSGLYLEYSFPDTGKYNITLLIIDSQGAKAYAYMNITVNDKPSISISLSKTTTDSGIPVEISAIVSGGTGPFNYTISVSGIGIIGYSNSMYYEFSSGDYNVTVTVYDSLGNRASASISIVVNSYPSVLIHAKYPNIDPNTTDIFNATITGGTSPYTLAWYVNGTYEGNQTSISFSFSAPGIYPVEARLTDAESLVSTSIIDVNVVDYPESTIIVSHYKIDANVSDSFRAEGTGGIGPYSYEFIINGHTLDNSTVSYSFPSPGIYMIQLTISDAFGHDATSYANITVYPDPALKIIYNGTPTASEPFNLEANVTGGIAPYSVSWIFSDETLSGFNISHVFSTSGPNTFEVKVIDSSDYILVKNYTVNVNLYVAITANTTRGLGPLLVAFSSSVLGGSDYSFNWTFSPGHYSLEQNPLYTFPSGNYTVHFEVTSANGAKGYANISIFSLPPPVSISYSNNKNITQYFYFNATANWDAKAPFNMTWSFPNGQNIEGMNIKYKFPVYNEFNTIVATFSYGNKTYTETFTVRMIPAKPVVTFTPPSVLPVDTMYSLNATAKAPDSNSFTYSWIINGVSYSGQTQLYYFSSTGNYSITVAATDSLGASSSVTQKIDILPIGKARSIAISYTKSTSGPEDYYTVKVLSTHGIISVEAFMSSQTLVISEINSTYTSAGELAYFNLTMDQRDYPVGDHSITIDVFNNQSQSNHLTIPFTVTSQYSSSTVGFGSIISFFGGISNFIITVLTFAGIAIAWASLRREDNPDVTIVEGTGKKAKRIRLQGKKVK